MVVLGLRSLSRFCNVDLRREDRRRTHCTGAVAVAVVGAVVVVVVPESTANGRSTERERLCLAANQRREERD